MERCSSRVNESLKKIFRKSIRFVISKYAEFFYLRHCKFFMKSHLRPVIQKKKVRRFVSFDFWLFPIWETGGVAVTSLSPTTES